MWKSELREIEARRRELEAEIAATADAAPVPSALHPLRETIPVGPLTVRIRVPTGVQVSGVRLLTAAATPRTASSNGVLTVTVPSVELHEVIAIDL